MDPQIYYVRTIKQLLNSGNYAKLFYPLGKQTTVAVRVKILNHESHGLRSSLPNEKSAGGAIEGRNASMICSQDYHTNNEAAASSDVLQGSVGGYCSNKEVVSTLPLPKRLWMLRQDDFAGDI